AAGREMLALGAQHDDAHTRVRIQRFEGKPELVALRHRDHVKRRPVENDVAALLRLVDLDVKAVERRHPRIAQGPHGHAAVPWLDGGARSASYSPATSRRRSNLPTGDFGICSTNT